MEHPVIARLTAYPFCFFVLIGAATAGFQLTGGRTPTQQYGFQPPPAALWGCPRDRAAASTPLRPGAVSVLIVEKRFDFSAPDSSVQTRTIDVIPELYISCHLPWRFCLFFPWDISLPSSGPLSCFRDLRLLSARILPVPIAGSNLLPAHCTASADHHPGTVSSTDIGRPHCRWTPRLQIPSSPRLFWTTTCHMIFLRRGRSFSVTVNMPLHTV